MKSKARYDIALCDEPPPPLPSNDCQNDTNRIAANVVSNKNGAIPWLSILTGLDNGRVVFSLKHSDVLHKFMLLVDTCNQKLFYLRYLPENLPH